MWPQKRRHSTQNSYNQILKAHNSTLYHSPAPKVILMPIQCHHPEESGLLSWSVWISGQGFVWGCGNDFRLILFGFGLNTKKNRQKAKVADWSDIMTIYYQILYTIYRLNDLSLSLVWFRWLTRFKCWDVFFICFFCCCGVWKGKLNVLATSEAFFYCNAHRIYALAKLWVELYDVLIRQCHEQHNSCKSWVFVLFVEYCLYQFIFQMVPNSKNKKT